MDRASGFAVPSSHVLVSILSSNNLMVARRRVSSGIWLGISTSQSKGLSPHTSRILRAYYSDNMPGFHLPTAALLSHTTMFSSCIICTATQFGDTVPTKAVFDTTITILHLHISRLV